MYGALKKTKHHVERNLILRELHKPLVIVPAASSERTFEILLTMFPHSLVPFHRLPLSSGANDTLRETSHALPRYPASPPGEQTAILVSRDRRV